MNKKVATIFFSAFGFFASAQIPQKCFEIESILVDACVPGGGCNSSMSPACNCEGKNEMVLFKIGNNPIQISNIDIDWPNNNFLGIANPDALTASLVASLNATIQTNCGWLVEPVAGVLPAGKKVLLITSTDMCVGANSFADLRDTLIVIFQNPGNYQGHFANHNNSSGQTTTPTGGQSLRTLIFIHIPDNCRDTVTYDRQYLLNINGLYGGAAALNDGSRVDFEWNGTPHYVNYGCQAPFTPTTVQANALQSSGCAGDVIALSANITGAFQSVQWTGGAGTFSNNSSTNTNYTISTGDVGTIILYVNVTDLCGDVFTDSVLININAMPSVTITASGPTTFCQGGSVVLTASGGAAYSWLPGGENSTAITVTNSGIYTVSSSTACGTSQASITVTVNPTPDATITSPATFCDNLQSVFLTSVTNGGTWSGTGVINGLTGEFSPQQAGAGIHTINYTVTQNGCTANSSQQITVFQFPDAQVMLSGNDTLCAGESLQLIASGGTTYLWSTGSTSSNIVVNQPGSYFVTATNSCGTDTSDVVMITVLTVNAAFTASPQSGNIPLQVNFTNNSTNADFYFWNFGNLSVSADTNPVFVFQNTGNHTVTLIAYNDFGCTDTARLTITAAIDAVLVIPNAISPNNDGLNDSFVILGIEHYPDNEIFIYNRWGNLIYHAHPYQNEWYGQSNNKKLRLSGDEVPDGTYFYVLKLNAEQNYNGFIELLRR